MPGFLPTEIAQVHDFTSGPGSRLVEATGRVGINPNDVFNLIDKTFGAFTRAQESENLARAIDAASRGMESGLTWTEAVSGLDPRVTGRKAFQDALQGTRTSIIEDDTNERDWARYQLDAAKEAREAANAASLKNANWYAADLLNTVSAYGPEAAAAHFERYKDKITSDPTVYSTYMSTLGKITGATTTPEIETVAPIEVNENLVADTQRLLNDLKVRFATAGVTTEELDTIKNPDLHAFTERESKRRNYEGEDAGDFAENVNRAYAKLRAAYPNASPSLVLSAMYHSLEAPWMQYLPWSNAQDDIDLDKAETFIKSKKDSWNNVISSAETFKEIEDAMKNQTADVITQSSLALQNKINQIKEGVRIGRLTPQQGQMQINALRKAFNTQYAQAEMRKAQLDLLDRALPKIENK